MSRDLHVGDRVLTPDFGEGIIRHIAGERVIVTAEEFNDLKLDYTLSDLKLVRAPESLGAADVAPEPVAEETDEVPRASGEQTEPRRAIEALRFGLVPSCGIEELTVGLEELRKWVIGMLPGAREGRASFAEVCGPFGTGKSHSMAVIRHVAERNGYVTGHVEVDGSQVSLSDPARLLASLWSSLRIDGIRPLTPLLDLYVRAIERGKSVSSAGDVGSDKIRDCFRVARLLLKSGCLDRHGPSLDALISSSPDMSPSILAYEIGSEPNISRSELRLKRMVSSRVAERPIDFVRSLVGHAIIAKLAGFQGMALTIDEFEVEHHQRGRFSRAAAVLGALQKYLDGRLGLPPAPLAIFVASVGQEGHVGDELLDEIALGQGGEPYELATIDESERRSLAERIHRLYCAAYGVDAPNEMGLLRRVGREAQSIERTDSGFNRALIKAIVSVCDEEYGPSGQRLQG